MAVEFGAALPSVAVTQSVALPEMAQPCVEPYAVLPCVVPTFAALPCVERSFVEHSFAAPPCGVPARCAVPLAEQQAPRQVFHHPEFGVAGRELLPPYRRSALLPAAACPFVLSLSSSTSFRTWFVL